MTSKWLLAVGLFLVHFVGLHAAQGADYPRPKRVLILDSFGPISTTVGAVAFRSALERELGQPVEIYHATLDAGRFPGANHEAQLTEFLKSRYQEHKLDLVAPMLAPAAQFVSRQQDLFGATPVVVTGIERRRIPPGLQTTTTTYVAGEGNFAGYIENALRLLPETRQIVMVFGAAKHDKLWAAEARRETQRFAGRVELIWLDDLTMKDMEKRVAALSRGSVAFLGLFYSDASGLSFDKDEGLRRLHAVAKVPIFGMFESSLGKGIVGGNLYPDVTIGVEGARVAIRVLNGEAPSAIEPVVIKERAPTYDWRELQRFGISENLLPRGSEIRFRPESLWYAYRWYITAAVALLILQAALISALILQRARRRRIEEERKLADAELLQTRGQLVHMTRVFTLGELSASLAHELNQPLTAILSNAQAAQRIMPGGGGADLQEVREILGDIVEADKRAGDVIRRLRSLVKKEELDATPVDIENAVREVALLLHSDAVQRHVDVSLEVEPALPQVQGNRIQLQQVVMNLLINAYDAVKDSSPGERAVVLKIERDGSHMLKVAVSDGGHGLSDDSPEHIFDAFYTTKPNGLGMGLSISRSIVEAHRGRLWAENNPTRGATFYFTIPLAAQ